MKYNKNHKIIFFGTSIFAVEVLTQLKELGLVPDAIVTTVDKPQGRKLIMTPPPAKIWATENSVPIYQFEKLKEEALHTLADLNPDLFIVASYGKIIPQSFLDLPKNGALNVHPSLLPEYRGPSPLQTCILEDSKNIGVTIIKMDSEMDHGPIVAIKRVEISPEEWPPNILDLKKILAAEGAQILFDVLPSWFDGNAKLTEQDHSKATFTKKIIKADGEIDISDTANTADTGTKAWKNYLKTQAFFGWPGTFFFIERHGKKIRVSIKSAMFDRENNKLIIERVTPEGGKEMDYKDFLRGV